MLCTHWCPRLVHHWHTIICQKSHAHLPGRNITGSLLSVYMRAMTVFDCEWELSYKTRSWRWPDCGNACRIYHMAGVDNCLSLSRVCNRHIFAVNTWPTVRRHHARSIVSSCTEFAESSMAIGDQTPQVDRIRNVVSDVSTSCDYCKYHLYTMSSTWR